MISDSSGSVTKIVIVCKRDILHPALVKGYLHVTLE